MLSQIFNTFANCLKIPELKSRIGFTFLLLAICRLEAFIRIPGLDGAALSHYFEEVSKTSGGGLLSMYSLFTGGALENCAVGALGIMPYISATIVIQLLTAVVPSLSKLAREEGGRVKIIKYSRYLTVLLCMGYGIFTAISWENPANTFSGFSGRLVLYDNIWYYRMQTVLILTVGTLLLMWLGEQITERGIGNGVSLVIAVGIMARLPAAGRAMFDMFHKNARGESQYSWGHAILLFILLAVVIAGCIALNQTQRKIPVQYAQRAVGRKIFQGGSSFLPLRLNFANVMPIIFAGAILSVPQLLFKRIGDIWPQLHFLVKWSAALNDGSMMHILLLGLMILFFSYFWTATQFNELQIADDLKKNGGYIPGVRPGQATSNYLHNSMSRITLAGAVFLTFIAVVPIILGRHLHVPPVAANFFGNTSMLIMVGVLLDTLRQMETHLNMRRYDGFLKGGSGGSRIRGRS
jgi:preprotein translocase subunit SecY